jgi:hypothetical protein
MGMMRRLILVFAIECGVGLAQQPGTAQPIGTVGMQNAMVSGALQVSNGQALLVGNTTVTARDHTAEMTLSRGGTVHVCATSGLHVTAGKSTTGAMPLMLALDRGAIEVQTPGTTSDVVMTPDLRFTLRGDGPLDLQLRVTRNGDTCVDNRGAKAPVLGVAEQFGDATYELRPGQHVLFEHGSLKEVVDHESSSCGCPPEPVMTVADALVNSGAPGAAGDGGTAKTAAEQHPFPTAVSEGLAAAAASVPLTPPGTVHAQVSATLSSNDSADSTADPAATAGTAAGGTATPAGTAGGAPASVAESPLPTAEPAPARGGLVHAVGRFFKRLFGGG